MEKKTYTETEITGIIGRAAKLQAIEKTRGTKFATPPGQEGLTIEELKAVASEAGIDPEFVEIASAESVDHFNVYAGIPVSISRSMFVHGTYADEHWTEMVAQFVKMFGGPGEVMQVGQRRTWTQGNIKITVEHAPDQVMMHATADWGKELEMPVAFAIVGGIATLVTAALAAISLEWSIGLVAILMGVIVAGAFIFFQNQKVVKQEVIREQLESTLNHCALLIHQNRKKGALDTEGINPRIVLPDAEIDETSLSDKSKAAGRIRTGN